MKPYHDLHQHRTPCVKCSHPTLILRRPTFLPTLPLILTHMHLLYKVSVYLRATKRKVPPLPFAGQESLVHFRKLSEILSAEDESNKPTQGRESKRRVLSPKRKKWLVRRYCWLLAA
ncbi:hypothetical protein DBV15_11413 [Temnothorax longispinosus]|uniref:Uncharacterized protein n=1 Tax=Temnothorax longispinosus TaxID=300112 RepID=A0A4S2KV57_9HYME|nr:hypothetical protein DBV15_11413 [Temnothorax longispinosus]